LCQNFSRKEIKLARIAQSLFGSNLASVRLRALPKVLLKGDSSRQGDGQAGFLGRPTKKTAKVSVVKTFSK
jgi:hypothetical protein